MSPSFDDRCVRCGACLSVCPVYNVTLKERFSPRGKNYILGRRDLSKRQALVRETMKACLQCGACSAVCTSGADIRSLISSERGRHAFFRSIPHPVYNIFTSTSLSRLCIKAADILPAGPTGAECRDRNPGLIKTCLETRNVLKPSGSPFLSCPHEWIGKFRPGAGHIRLKADLPGIALFVGCAQNVLFPEVPGKIAGIIGSSVFVPEEQTCCGLPAFSAGAVKQSRKAALRNLDAFDRSGFEILLTGCASCASMIRKWPLLFEKGSRARKRAICLSEKVMEFSSFALKFLEPAGCVSERTVAFQMPCHQRYGLAQPAEPLRLLARNLGKNFVPGELGCCGQGGLFGFVRPDLADKIFEKTFSRMEPGVNMVTTTCSGCLIRLKTGLSGLELPGGQMSAGHIVDTMVPD